MTAPLVPISTEHTLTLRHTFYHLLDAIDNNYLSKVEQLMCEMLRENVPEVSIQLFYNYAQKKECIEICDYFRMMLLVTHNNTNKMNCL